MVPKLFFLCLIPCLLFSSGVVLASTESADPFVAPMDVADEEAPAKAPAMGAMVDDFELLLKASTEPMMTPAEPADPAPCFLECSRDSDCHPSGACRCIFIAPACGYCNC